MKNIINKLVLSMALLVGMVVAQNANAANIKMEVKVNISGVSTWVLVKYGSWPKYGGHVEYDSTLRCYVTDDVARGETMRITVTPLPGEIICKGFNYGIWCDSKSKYLLTRTVALPYVDSNYVVPIDQTLDNLYVDVYTTFPFSPKRIPIGPRVK